ncbi:MAG TPA: ECF-type sigma factor [Thermoanaerobaculia bacterium]|nr:ECF-type sigma factor [Thermoanaerobaculia bacterium]
MAAPGEVTRLLRALRDGDPGALERLTPLVYDQLRAVARRQLRRRRPGQTLETTALVHEAYVKLIDARQADWRDREHFLSVAAVAMRHVLVDAARRRMAGKRGGNELRVTLSDLDRLADGTGRGDDRVVEILAVDQALAALTALSPRLARLVELVYFGGLTEEEAGRALGISDRTVRRDWRKARAFLFQALGSRPCG